MNKSESIKNLAMALKKAQAVMGEVVFDSTNPFYKSRYASLGAMISSSKAALINNGLSVSQPATTTEFGVGVTTILMHESGEYIESTISLPVVDQKNLAQEAGKIITYLRRYSLASILNLYSDEDTDAESPKNKKPLPANKSPKPAGITIEEAENIIGKSDGKKYADCTDDELKGKLAGLSKKLNANSLSREQESEVMYRLNAIKVIQESRKK